MNDQKTPGAGERSAPPAGSTMIYSDGTWSRDELMRLASGAFIDRNGKRYAMCHNCRTVIRVDKPIFGSIHVCQ